MRLPVVDDLRDWLAKVIAVRASTVECDGPAEYHKDDASRVRWNFELFCPECQREFIKWPSLTGFKLLLHAARVSVLVIGILIAWLHASWPVYDYAVLTALLFFGSMLNFNGVALKQFLGLAAIAFGGVALSHYGPLAMVAGYVIWGLWGLIVAALVSCRLSTPFNDGDLAIKLPFSLTSALIMIGLFSALLAVGLDRGHFETLVSICSAVARFAFMTLIVVLFVSGIADAFRRRVEPVGQIIPPPVPIPLVRQRAFRPPMRVASGPRFLRRLANALLTAAFLAERRVYQLSVTTLNVLVRTANTVSKGMFRTADIMARSIVRTARRMRLMALSWLVVAQRISRVYSWHLWQFTRVIVLPLFLLWLAAEAFVRMADFSVQYVVSPYSSVGLLMPVAGSLVEATVALVVAASLVINKNPFRVFGAAIAGLIDMLGIGSLVFLLSALALAVAGHAGIGPYRVGPVFVSVAVGWAAVLLWAVAKRGGAVATRVVEPSGSGSRRATPVYAVGIVTLAIAALPLVLGGPMVVGKDLVQAPSAVATPTVGPPLLLPPAAKTSPVVATAVGLPTPGVRVLYGPVSGQLDHVSGAVSVQYATVKARDFAAEARFYNPYDALTGAWDYGFMFPNVGGEALTRQYRITVRSDKTWDFHLLEFNKDLQQRLIATARGTVSDLNTASGESNHLRLVVNASTASFFVNASEIPKLDVSQHMESGGVAIGTGFFSDAKIVGKATRYEGFTVWALPGQ